MAEAAAEPPDKDEASRDPQACLCTMRMLDMLPVESTWQKWNRYSQEDPPRPLGVACVDAGSLDPVLMLRMVIASS